MVMMRLHPSNTEAAVQAGPNYDVAVATTEPTTITALKKW